MPGQREGARAGRAAGCGAGHLRNGAPCRVNKVLGFELRQQQRSEGVRGR